MNDYKTPEEFLETYGYDIDGTWYPRVTRIVEIKAKPALYRFYAELPNFQEGEKIKEQSAAEGTRVHEAIESLLVGDTPAQDSDLLPVINAFDAFQSTHSIQVDKEFVEYRIVHKEERYAGTMDALAHIDGKYGVLDIKTSQSIYRDYNLQTSAYMAALEKEFPTISTRWILRIDQHQTCSKCGAIRRVKGGREKVRLPYGSGLSYGRFKQCAHMWSPIQGDIELLECHDWRSDYRAFLGAKQLWEWEHADVLRSIGYLK